MSNLGISNDELKIVVAFGLFGGFWMLFVIPTLIDSQIYQAANPLIQWFVYNVGLFGLITAILGVPLGKVAEGGSMQTKLLRGGLSAFLSFATLDDLQPPFYLNPQGHVVIQNVGTLSGASVDSMLTFLWRSLIPSAVDTPLLYQLVYIASPVIILLAAAFMLKPTKFKEMVHRGLT